MKMLTVEKINKARNKLSRQNKARCLRWAREHLEASKLDIDSYGDKVNKEYELKQVEHYQEKSLEKCQFSLKYKVRSHEFSNSRNLHVDADTLEGRSYRWYSISRVLKGTLYLNTYAYSSTTSGHVGTLRRLFRELGLKFETLEAPQGLQNLDVSMRYYQRVLAELIVKNKYARKPVSTKYLESKIKVLRELGIKTGRNWLKPALETAELKRRSKLDATKARKKHQLDLKAIKIVLVQPGETVPTGVYVEYNQYFHFGSYSENRLRERALDSGFNAIAVCLFDEPAEDTSLKIKLVSAESTNA